MLTLGRTEGESILLHPSSNIPSHMTVAELFANGSIEIELKEAKRGRARIGINAPDCIEIVREEILNK